MATIDRRGVIVSVSSVSRMIDMQSLVADQMPLLRIMGPWTSNVPIDDGAAAALQQRRHSAEQDPE